MDDHWHRPLPTPQVWLGLTAIAMALPWLPVLAQTGGGFDLGWNRAGAGTAATASGGGFELQSAMGQPVAGWAEAEADGWALVEGYGAIYAVQAYDLRLRLGWNLISLPLVPLSAEMADILPAGIRRPLWKHTPTGYQPVLQAEPMEGYWVWTAAASSRVIQGILVEEPVRDLDEGWNLVGVTGLPPYPDLDLPLAAEPAGAIALPVWGWHAAPRCQLPVGLSLAVGEAYWVYATAPATVRLGP
jgi:hypothetical protein